MATEKRLIDANECYERAWDYTAFYHHVADMSILRDLLNDCPTVDAVEVVHGRWERAEEFDFISGEYVTTGYHCDKCGCYYKKRSNYCPNCGAKMNMEVYK